MQAPWRLRGQRILSRTFVTLVRQAAIPVQAWIVDESEDMRMMLDWGVTGLISDRPDRAVDAVRRWREQ
jgi:glycerophosphoryl diester phosphodiesterase